MWFMNGLSDPVANNWALSRSASADFLLLFLYAETEEH